MNKRRNWFHCEVVFGVNIFDLDFGFQIDSVEQPVKSNSVGSGHVSHLWNDFRLCRLVRNRSLFLAHPTDWKECSTSKTPPEVDVWIFKITSTVWVLQQTQSTTLCRVSHVTILSEIVCVMNVRNQLCQASVTCLSPFCEWSRKLVDRPQGVRSSKSCQVFKTICEQTSDNSPIDSSSSCLNWWYHPNKGLTFCCKVAPLSCFPVHSIAQRIFEHVLPCRTTTLLFLFEIFPIRAIFRLLQQKYAIQTSSHTVQ